MAPLHSFGRGVEHSEPAKTQVRGENRKQGCNRTAKAQVAAEQVSGATRGPRGKKPPRAIAILLHMNIVTKPTHEKKSQALKELAQRIAKIREDMAEARDQGDLSENFGYTEARKQLETQKALYEERSSEHALSQVIDPLDWADIDMEELPRAMIGSLVTFELKGETHTSLLGGSGDEYPKVIPYNSPLGKALIPKLEGQTVELEIAGKTEVLRIKKCEVPTKKKLQEIYGITPIITKSEMPSKEITGPEPM